MPVPDGVAVGLGCATCRAAQHHTSRCHGVQMKADDPRCRAPLVGLHEVIRCTPAGPSSTAIHIVSVRKTWLSGQLPSPKFIFGWRHARLGQEPRAIKVQSA